MVATTLRPLGLTMVLGLVLAGPALAQGKAPATAAERFAQLDRNHDGVVSEDEYDAHALFTAMDTDRNYRVSAAEVEAFFGPQADGTPSAADRIRNLDRNGDGEIEDEEMENAAEARFHWLDTNEDGKLDLSELRAGFGVQLSRP